MKVKLLKKLRKRYVWYYHRYACTAIGLGYWSIWDKKIRSSLSFQGTDKAIIAMLGLWCHSSLVDKNEYKKFLIKKNNAKKV